MNSYRNIVWLFGLPIDVLTTDEAIQTIMEMTASRTDTSPPHLVTTVNTDFLVNALPWFGSIPRHPELIRILRNADISTADGMPLVWAARLLGSRLPERVTGADLVPKLAEAAAAHNRSIYMFGGREEVARQAAHILQHNHPNLTIAGVDSPFVTTKGNELATAQESDEPLCDRINAANPDILLIAFGNPKQELWFGRNRHRLKAGVTLGIGGTFDFIAGHQTRAPQWMQRMGMEWAFRLFQEPFRLFRRYLVDALKLGIYVSEVSAYYFTGKVREKLFTRATDANNVSVVSRFYSGRKCLRLLHFQYDHLTNDPSCYLDEIHNTTEDEAVVFDCDAIHILNCNQLGSLILCWKHALRTQQPVFLTNVDQSLKQSFKSNWCWDILSPYTCTTPADTLVRLAPFWTDQRGYISLEKNNKRLEFSIFGALEAADVAHLDVQTLAEQFARQPCLINLQLCSTIDSTGIGFLSRVRGQCADNGLAFAVTGTSKRTHNMIRAAELETTLNIIPNIARARNYVSQES